MTQLIGNLSNKTFIIIIYIFKYNNYGLVQILKNCHDDNIN